MGFEIQLLLSFWLVEASQLVGLRSVGCWLVAVSSLFDLYTRGRSLSACGIMICGICAYYEVGKNSLISFDILRGTELSCGLSTEGILQKSSCWVDLMDASFAVVDVV